MPKITGAKAHAARLKFMVSPEAKAGIGRALFAGGQLIEVEAARLITAGSVSGKGHVPSSPGEAPNNDTGVLARNIETVQVEVDLVEVSSNAPYAAALEFGTSKIAERPYMRPAVAAKQAEVTDLVRRAVAHIAKGGTVR
jgi:HK97 gp10 family phage protein